MKRPVPICWVSCVGEKGGAETLMIECLRALDTREFEPHVVLLRPGPLEGLLAAVGATVHTLKTHRMREAHRVVGAVWRIRALARKHGFQVLHSNGFRAHWYGGLAARLAGVGEVWTTHTVESRSWHTRMILGVPTTRMLTNCTRTDDFFRARGVPTTLVWPPVNTEALAQAATAESRDDLAARFNLPKDRVWLTVASRLQEYKGQGHFLRAFARLPDSCNAHGIIAGGALFGQETGYPAELRQMTAQLGLTGRITFTGFLNNPAGLLHASDLVVHPALDEDFGLTVAEAQGLGKAVVAFAAVGPSVIILPGVTGWLAPVGDIDALTASIIDALSDRERLHRYGKAAIPAVKSRFDASIHARKTEEAYRLAAQRHR